MYGFEDLKPRREINKTQVGCPVKGCHVRVLRQDVIHHTDDRYWCPEHRIMVMNHGFEYDDERRNLLWDEPEDLDLWWRVQQVGVRGIPARDMHDGVVTWNVFRYLERRRLLGKLVEMIDGREPLTEPRIMYWCYCQRTRRAWEPLARTAALFGKRPERWLAPGIIIDAEQALVFVLANLDSEIASWMTNADRIRQCLTACEGWYHEIFQPSAGLHEYNPEKPVATHLQMWLFGSWIARQQGKRFYLLDLYGQLRPVEDAVGRYFGQYLITNEQRRFFRLSWETLYRRIIAGQPLDRDTRRMTWFFHNKSYGYAYKAREALQFARLRHAFQVSALTADATERDGR